MRFRGAAETEADGAAELAGLFGAADSTGFAAGGAEFVAGGVTSVVTGAGGRGGGTAAQSRPTVRNIAAPSAGSQRGVRGSARAGDVAFTGSVMAWRGGLTTNRTAVSSEAAGSPKRAIIRP
jgi:hypothetical protein